MDDDPLAHDAPPHDDPRDGRTGRHPSGAARASAGANSGRTPAEKGDAPRRREFLWKVHAYTNDYIRFADAKAGFCAGVASALMGALFASRFQDFFTKALARDPGATWNLLAGASLLAFTFLGASVVAAIAAIRPRLWTHSNKGFIFWESISSYRTAAEFGAAYETQTELELNACLSHHLYSLATICRRKYACVNAAIWLTTIGGAFAAIALLLNR